MALCIYDEPKVCFCTTTFLNLVVKVGKWIRYIEMHMSKVTYISATSTWKELYVEATEILDSHWVCHGSSRRVPVYASCLSVVMSVPLWFPEETWIKTWARIMQPPYI